MIIFNVQKIAEFIFKHSDSESSLVSWRGVATAASWKNPAEMKQSRRDADLVGRCTVFNIARNKYRLIAQVDYRAQAISIKHILTHAEYDKEKWKKDCQA